MVYFGDANHAVDMFDAAGMPVPNMRNPADHFLHCINRDFAVSWAGRAGLVGSTTSCIWLQHCFSKSLPTRCRALTACCLLCSWVQDSDEIETNIHKLVTCYKESKVYAGVKKHVMELEASPGACLYAGWHCGGKPVCTLAPLHAGLLPRCQYVVPRCAAGWQLLSWC